MKVSEIRELTVAEIIEKIQLEKSGLAKSKLNHAISPLDNPVQIRVARRNIARLQTVLRQKQNENK
ncbi:50S ribosomal protein L29 [Prolixibacteraceae bacterium JC049]|nr:50S ribosomal protein L29 [Prolixibacteraceae bacterium JC049]